VGPTRFVGLLLLNHFVEIERLIEGLPPERLAAHQANDERVLSQTFASWAEKGLIDPEALSAIRKEGTRVVVSASCAGRVDGAEVMRNGDVREELGFRIEAVPAYNVVHMRAPGQPYHAEGVGKLLAREAIDGEREQLRLAARELELTGQVLDALTYGGVIHPLLRERSLDERIEVVRRRRLADILAPHRLNFVDHITIELSRENEHGQLPVHSPDLSQQIQAISVWKNQVQDDAGPFRMVF